jgi:hypothetical protein
MNLIFVLFAFQKVKCYEFVGEITLVAWITLKRRSSESKTFNNYVMHLPLLDYDHHFALNSCACHR